MTGIIIAIILALGVGGTISTADNARPGDALFGIDQAVENARIAFAGDDNKKDELRIKFAEERVKEIEDLVEDSDSDDDRTSTPDSTEISDLTVSEIEADIFTNETVVKIEHNDQKTVITMEAKKRDDVVTSLMAKYPSLTRPFIEKTINVEFEDRPGRDDDKSVSGKKRDLSVEEQAKVNAGIEAVLDLLSKLKEQQGENSQVDDITAKLNALVADFPANARIEISDEKFKIKFEDDKSEGDSDASDEFEIKEESENNKSKIEIRNEEGRIKVEVKNGVLEIKTKLDADSSQPQIGDVSNVLEEAEAKIFPDKTIVELEIGDQKTVFSTSANTRDEIIAAIIAKFPNLSKEQIGTVLKIESEDGDEDKDEDGEKDEDSDDDKDSDSDSDDDSDDDDSNSGNGNR